MGTIAAYVGMAVLLIGGLVLLLTSSRPKSKSCPKCQRVMMPDWVVCRFCGADPRLLAGCTAMLHFVTGPLTNQVVVLDRPKITIGSVAGNDIVLQDKGVSRKHVGIRRVEGGYELMDFGSTNGVYVNGDKTPKRMLAVGDVIRVGSTECVFRV